MKGGVSPDGGLCKQRGCKTGSNRYTTSREGSLFPTSARERVGANKRDRTRDDIIGSTSPTERNNYKRGNPRGGTRADKET